MNEPVEPILKKARKAIEDVATEGNLHISLIKALDQ